MEEYGPLQSTYELLRGWFLEAEEAKNSVKETVVVDKFAKKLFHEFLASRPKYFRGREAAIPFSYVYLV